VIKSKLEQKKKDNPLSAYARYSSLALQMIAISVAGAFGGKALDAWLQPGFPIFTVVLTILAVIGSVVYAMRGLFKNK